MKLKTTLLLLVTTLLALTGCKDKPSTSETVRMAYQPIVFGMPVFVGQEQKLFQKNAVNVEAQSFTSANDMINALVAGQVHIVPGAPLVPVLSLESKYPGKFRVFAHSVMTSAKPFDRILVKKESPIKSVGDLAGKRLALIPGTTALNTIKAYLKRSNVDPASVTFVQLAPPAQLPALESNSVDALYAYEPMLTVALAQDRYVAITPSVYCSMLEPCPLVVSIIDRDFERKHPEEARRAISALSEAASSMKNKPEEASLALVPYTKIDPALAPKVSLQNMTVGGDINRENLQQFINILVEIGELQSGISVDTLLAPTQ
jgi:NitT/TauT family transport system substrate-binding protein